MLKYIKDLLRKLSGKKNWEERRRFVRLKSHNLLKYKVIEESQDKPMSFTRNISAGGVLFYSKEYIEPQTMLELQLLLRLHSEPVKVIARAVRVNALKKTGGYEIGAEFINIDKDKQQAINEKILESDKKQQKKKKG